MADLKDIRVTLSKSNFDVTVKKFDGKLTVTDPITVRNQIYEFRSLADVPNVNTVNLVDGATIIYNANNHLYEIRPLERLTNLTVSNTLFVNHVSANGSLGANGRVLTSNGSYVYWSSLGSGTINGVIAGDGLIGGGSDGTVTLSVNTDYIATLSANSATYANIANYLNGKAESALDANTALYANVATYALTLIGTGAGDLNVNSAYYATVASTALNSNNSAYAYGKQESQINANSAMYLAGGGWSTPGPIGSTTPNTAVFTTVQHSGLTFTQGTNVDQLLTVTDTRAVTTDWQNTGINSVLLPIGSYMLQMVSPLNEIVTGVMSWYPNNTNNQTGDEILLHRATPDVSGTLFLRIYRSANVDIDMVLQIAGTSNRTSGAYTYKFRRMI